MWGKYMKVEGSNWQIARSPINFMLCPEYTSKPPHASLSVLAFALSTTGTPPLLDG
jgi:hypothetical protein